MQVYKGHRKKNMTANPETDSELKHIKEFFEFRSQETFAKEKLDLHEKLRDLGAETKRLDEELAEGRAALAAERAASNRAAWNSLSAASLVAVPFVGVAPAQFCGTILSLLHAQRVPTRFVRVGAHPLLLCAGAASVLCAVAAHTHAISFEAALDLFRTQNGTFAGPGDTLFELMNASLVALGLQATSFCVAFLEFSVVVILWIQKSIF